MIYILTNAIPIVVAALTGTALLAGLWWRRRRTALLVAAFVANLWLAAILAGALILAPVEADRWTIVLGSPFIIWVGFVLPSLVVTLRARNASWLSAISDAGVWLAVMLVEAAVMQLIGLVKP